MGVIVSDPARGAWIEEDRSRHRFHDMRRTFASWFLRKGGDVYELVKILVHASIKSTERYANLAQEHIARVGNTACELWKLLGEGDEEPATGTV